ncbi:hypothetical protein Tco_0633296, partial [Tanacetum coccineum]
EAMLRINLEMGDINYLDLYIPQCVPAMIAHPPTHQPHPCDIVYTLSDLDQGYFRIHVPNLQKATGASLAHFLYSGDTHPCVPSAGTIYSLESMGLDVIEPWQKWMLPNTTKESITQEHHSFPATHDFIYSINIPEKGSSRHHSSPKDEDRHRSSRETRDRDKDGYRHGKELCWGG